MTTKTQILLDKYIVGNFVRMINLLVISLGKILKIDHHLNRSFSTIAICKYKGMGSIIQSTPLIKTLKNNNPDLHLVFITSIENKEIIKLIADIDEVVYINDRSFSQLLFSFFPFILRLIKLKIDVYIDLEVYSNFSTLVSLLSLSTNRLGFYINSKHYRLGNYTHMMYYNTRSSISETYLQFSGMLNCSEKLKGLYKFKPLPFPTQLTTNREGFEPNRYIIINPNASDLRIERQWPKNNFIQLIQDLSGRFVDKNILLIGSKKEANYVQTIMDQFPDTSNILNLAGKTTIAELISLVQNAQIVITNDTGPMHIAFSVETPTIAMFGPCSPNQYGINKNCIVVYQNLYCSPCVHDFVTPPCRGNNYCMKSITPKKVFDLFVQYSYNQENAKYNGIRNEILFNYENFTIGTINRS